MTRSELLNSKEYWIAKIQMDLFAEVKKYLLEQNLSRTALAEKLGVSKAYISQILNGDFNHRISKLVELSLAIGKVPSLEFVDINTIDGNQYKDQVLNGNPLPENFEISNTKPFPNGSTVKEKLSSPAKKSTKKIHH